MNVYQSLTESCNKAVAVSEVIKKCADFNIKVVKWSKTRYLKDSFSA